MRQIFKLMRSGRLFVFICGTPPAALHPLTPSLTLSLSRSLSLGRPPVHILEGACAALALALLKQVAAPRHKETNFYVKTSFLCSCVRQPIRKQNLPLVRSLLLETYDDDKV